MSLNATQKACRGRLEFAKKCREQGYTAVRCTKGQLDCRGLPGIHVSVRRSERPRLDQELRQAAEESGDRLPVLAHRTNRSSWKITMELQDFFRLYRAFSQRPLPDPASPASEPCHGSDPDFDRRPEAPVSP